MARPKSPPIDHKLLKRLFEEHGVDTVQMGRILDVNDSTVGRWIRGENGPNSAEAVALARHFAVSLPMLYGWPETEAEAMVSRVQALPPTHRRIAIEQFNTLIKSIETAAAAELAEQAATSGNDQPMLQGRIDARNLSAGTRKKRK